MSTTAGAVALPSLSSFDSFELPPLPEMLNPARKFSEDHPPTPMRPAPPVSDAFQQTPQTECALQSAIPLPASLLDEDFGVDLFQSSSHATASFSPFSNPQPHSLESLPAFSNGQSLPAFSSGQSLPAFSNGQSLPAFSNLESLPVLSNGESLPAFGNGESLPAFQNGGSLPAFGNGKGESKEKGSHPQNRESSADLTETGFGFDIIGPDDLAMGQSEALPVGCQVQSMNIVLPNQYSQSSEIENAGSGSLTRLWLAPHPLVQTLPNRTVRTDVVFQDAQGQVVPLTKVQEMGSIQVWSQEECNNIGGGSTLRPVAVKVQPASGLPCADYVLPLFIQMPPQLPRTCTLRLGHLACSIALLTRQHAPTSAEPNKSLSAAAAAAPSNLGTVSSTGMQPLRYGQDSKVNSHPFSAGHSSSSSMTTSRKSQSACTADIFQRLKNGSSGGLACKSSEGLDCNSSEALDCKFWERRLSTSETTTDQQQPGSHSTKGANFREGAGGTQGGQSSHLTEGKMDSHLAVLGLKTLPPPSVSGTNRNTAATSSSRGSPTTATNRKKPKTEEPSGKETNESAESIEAKNLKKNTYKCRLCLQPKRAHICTFCKDCEQLRGNNHQCAGKISKGQSLKTAPPGKGAPLVKSASSSKGSDARLQPKVRLKQV